MAEGVTGQSPALAKGAGATGTPAISQEDWFMETFTIPLLLYLILLCFTVWELILSCLCWGDMRKYIFISYFINTNMNCKQVREC